MITLTDLYNRALDESHYLGTLVAEAEARLANLRGRLDGYAHLIEAGHGAITLPDPDPSPEEDGAIHPPVEAASPSPTSGAAADMHI